MIAEELEAALHRAFVSARNRSHKFIGVEHLLLAVLDTPSGRKVLHACGADLAALRKDIEEHIAANTPPLTSDQAFDTQPTFDFQRVIQRGVLKAQTAGKNEVTGADMLLAILVEQKSHAVDLLKAHGAAWLDAANFVSHGISKGAPQEGKPEEDTESPDLQVVLYNDDFTPMVFVVRVLEDFFGMDGEDAKEAVLEIHREGAAVCGLYSRESAKYLVEQVLAHAAEHGYPLRCAAIAPK